MDSACASFKNINNLKYFFLFKDLHKNVSIRVLKQVLQLEQNKEYTVL